MRSFFAAPVAVLLGALAWMVAMGAFGVLMTELGPWYYALRKPSWQPPDFLFGPVWSTIFLLSAVAFVLGWISPVAGTRDRWLLVAVYVINGVLNNYWSFLFFRSRRPDFALVEVGALWLSILAMILILRPLSTVAALLVTPYLCWVTFATVLNRAIVQLNGPFGSR